MGEIHLDSENLFHPFGWTPARATAMGRASDIRYFDHQFVPTQANDVAAVRSLGRSTVLALTHWVDVWFSTAGSARSASMSYGKLDPGVRAVLKALKAQSFEHIEVGAGEHVAEDEMLRRVSGSHWSGQPYAIGSSDARVASAIVDQLSSDPTTAVMLIVGPGVYARRWHWFESTTPEQPARFPSLKGYGLRYVALHLLTIRWIEAQSRSRNRQAPELGSSDVDTSKAALENRWEAWSLFRFPRPSRDQPLSSARWVNACRDEGIPDSIVGPIREEITRLYGGAFERGCGPVSWTLACWAAAAVPFVTSGSAERTDSDDEAFQRAKREAWLRLMSR